MTPAMKQAKEALKEALEYIREWDDLTDDHSVGICSCQQVERLNEWSAALAALESESADDGWMPIESAPKDGTVIWTYSMECATEKAWWSKMYGEWIAHRGLTRLTPTHYRPLPAPPKEKA